MRPDPCSSVPDLAGFTMTWYFRDKFIAQSDRTALHGIRSGIFVPRPAMMPGTAVWSADIPSDHQADRPEEPAGSE
jgi:hypothetical protein